MRTEDQIKVLKERFRAPSSIRLLQHKKRSESGEREDGIADCCQAVKATMRGALVAAASNGGINGVIQYFTSNFTWGCVQGQYYCDCFANKNQLFCVGTACVGLESLHFYRSISPSSADFNLVSVEVIVSCCPSFIHTEKLRLSEFADRHSTHELSHGWVLDDTYYHVMVGIVEKQLGLNICDYDARMSYLLSDNESATKISCMRVSPWTGDGAETRHTNELKTRNHVVWNGTQIAINRWVDINDASFEGSACMDESVAVLRGAYGNRANPAKQISIRSHPSSTSMTTDISNSVFTPSSDSIGFTCTQNTQKAASLTVLISGTFMGTNPCAGVGVARALRTALGYHNTRLIAVGDAAFSDPAFDASLSAKELGAASHLSGPKKLQKQWDSVVELIFSQTSTGDENVFFIPGCDLDIDLMSQGKSALLQAQDQRAEALIKAFDLHLTAALPLQVNRQLPADQLTALCRSILCPRAEVVALTEKPEVLAATRGPLSAFFQVPEYLNLQCTDGSPARLSLLEMRAFADRIGYPVVLKGPRQGATVCDKWFQLRAAVTSQQSVQGGFIQKCARGFEKCLAFAAFEGRLLGHCLMTKGSSTEKGKVWSGDIEPLPTSLAAALEEFVRLTEWTGGGEIEFIEEISPSGSLSFNGEPARSLSFLPRSSVPQGEFAADDLVSVALDDLPTPECLPSRWVVDFNPRFPAWIFASAYSGCNLPALLIAAAKNSTDGDVPRAVSSDSDTGLLVDWRSTTSIPSDSTPSGDADSTPTEPPVPQRVSFVRSLIEIPVVHTQHYRSLPQQSAGGVSTDKGKLATPTTTETFRYDVLPELFHQEDPCENTDPSLQHLVGDFHRLTDAAVALLQTGAVECTPRYILCTATFKDTLQRLSALFASAAAKTGLSVQLCLSVKTQPQTALLRAAAEAGYFAECIDLAEVYHSVFHGEFTFDRVVLTGPGKWWDTKHAHTRSEELACWMKTQPQASVNTKYHAIFADSLSDLETIVRRLTDANDTLDTDVVGIRWTPLWSTSSRFGLDCKDVKIVRRAAELVRQLPAAFRLGMHFHHAASVLGGARWFGLAQAFSVFCAEFSNLCGRPVATIDFGGGFEPYFLEHESTQLQLRELFGCVRETCDAANNEHDLKALDSASNSYMQLPEEPVCIQFELGKCISEPAGGVLTRILAIREREGSCNTKEEEEEAAQAIIVDTTIADLSVPNSHPVYWIQQHQDSDRHITYTCVLLRSGSTAIWGRTCMEWDKVHGAVDLPAEAAVGDYLLIAGCGAYDMSMQYGFGDGVERKENVILA